MKSTCHNSRVIHYTNGYYCPVCFMEQWQKTKHIGLVYAGACLLLLMIVANAVKAPSIYSLPGITPTTELYRFCIQSKDDIVPSDSSVLAELVKNKSVLPSVAVAQARIESANYTSDIAEHNKNLFGIKVHKCKYVTGQRKGHATFASYKDNIACYCHIQERYLKKIDKAYAEDPLYIEKVKQMK